MGSVVACLGCYCCLYTFKPRCMEIISLIADLFAIGFMIWGFAEIPWDDISTGGKATFYITFCLICICLILLIILIIMRCNNTINTTSNKAAVNLCIGALAVDCLALILCIISESLILYKMWDLDENIEYFAGRRVYRSNGYYTDAEWAAAILSATIGEIGIAVYFYCMSFLLKLIFIKTDLSYAEYAKNNPNENITINPLNNDINSSVVGTNINVYNNPPTSNQNQLNFLGYDKNGHPIYAGNNQYRQIDFPVNKQPNIVNATNNNNLNKSDNTDDNKK